MTNLSTYFPQRPDYTPAMMQFDGASYYEKTGVAVGANNAITATGRFAVNTSANDQRIITYRETGGSYYYRLAITVKENDHASAPRKLQAYVQNNAGAIICRANSTINVDDGAVHSFFFSYDATAGTAILIVDGADVLDTSNPIHSLTTGTLPTTSMSVVIGADSAIASYGTKLTGQIGLVGFVDAYRTNWQDFMDAQGNPKPLNEFGWTQWGGGTFAPASQLFDGSTGYFSKSAITTSGNKVTAVLRFKRASFTGDVYNHIFMVGNTHTRLQAIIISNNHSTLTNRQGKFQVDVQNSSGTVICKTISSSVMADGAWHTAFISFDGDAGTLQMIIDGVDEDDTGNPDRVAPTTGTLESGSSFVYSVGASTSGTNKFTGEIDFCGYKDGYFTNWGDFMDATGVPQEIDELSWTEWGGQPLFWNKYGAMDDNKGSAGNMTRNGTVTHTPNSQPLFWHEAAKMDEQLGSAGVMTENGTILLGKGGN